MNNSVDEDNIFGRSFVAANKRCELRCSNCKHEYAHHLKSTNFKDSCRPFLLHCAHTICEECILRDGDNLKCAVCFRVATPTIKPNVANAKRTDYYELNYHVLGETKSLDYMQQQLHMSRSNNNLISPTSSRIVLEPSRKCFECGYNSNTGKCQQCNEVLCKRCFQTMHPSHSRVLGKHLFTPLNHQWGDRSPRAKQMAVGKQIFEMPMELVCYGHNIPATFFCEKCRRYYCEMCIRKKHGRHPNHSLAQKNQILANRIPGTVYAIDAALSRIRKGQEVCPGMENFLNT